jgi:hypothetical protein
MVVSFGRNRGEHTLGEVVRVTRKNVKVVQLEPRGANKSYEVGSLWLVPKEMVSPAKVPTDRVEAGKKSVAEHQTQSPPVVVKLKRDSGIVPVKDARATLREVALKSAGVTPSGVVPTRKFTPEWVATISHTTSSAASAQMPDERGCPVLIDPVTQYHFVGRKGEDLGPFIERIKSVVAR